MPDGPLCKDCRAEGQGIAEYRNRPAPHPGPRCATHHRQVVKARKQAAAERRNVNTYGLAEGDYERLYAFQGGRCAICQVATGKVRRLAVDHRHSDGFVRGLLCKTCNRIIGFARDNPEWFQRAAQYLQHPPAFRINIMAKHVDNRVAALEEAMAPVPKPGSLQPWPFVNPDLPAARELNRERRTD